MESTCATIYEEPSDSVVVPEEDYKSLQLVQKVLDGAARLDIPPPSRRDCRSCSP